MTTDTGAFAPLQHKLHLDLYKQHKIVLESHLKSAILSGNVNFAKYVFDIIGIGIPDKALSWAAVSKKINQELVNIILEKMLKAADTFKLISSKVNTAGAAIVSETNLNLMLTELNLQCCSNYEKNFLLYDLLQPSPINNIFDIFTEHQFVHLAVCEAAYYANCKFIEMIFDYLNTHHISYIFQPSLIRDRKDIFKWLEFNINRAQCGQAVGWRCGPDSGLWPSTTPQDYLDTNTLLKSVSLVEY